MEVLALTVSAPVVSFRRPLDHNYQRTLPLPPPTTLLGLAGAALGLSDHELWRENGSLSWVKVSVLLHESPMTKGEPGKARDMWTVMKIKGGKITDRSPYLRELLFFTRFTILYGSSKNGGILSELREAFEDPVYALSLGREDELIFLEEVGLFEVSSGSQCFRGTAVPGDIRNKAEGILNFGPGLRFEPPQVETLPRSFVVNKKGIREPKKRIPLTFIPLDLELEVPGISPVFSFRGRNFTWLNS